MDVKEALRVHSSATIQLVRDKHLNSDKVISCGADAQLGVYSFEGNDFVCEDVEVISATQSAAAWNGDDVYLAVKLHDHQNSLIKLNLSDKTDESLATFPMGLTALDVSTDNSFIVAGSCDHQLKCFQLDRDKFEMCRVLELDGQICSITISPNDRFFAVSTSSGTFHLFEREGVDEAAVKSITVCNKLCGVRSDQPRLKAAWSEDSNDLYLPSTGCVLSYRADDWMEASKYSVEGNRVLSSVNANNNIIAACSADGCVVCWNRNKTGSPVFQSTVSDLVIDCFLTDIIVKSDGMLFLSNSAGSVFHLGYTADDIENDEDEDGDLSKIKSQFVEGPKNEVYKPIEYRKPKRQLPDVVVPGMVSLTQDSKSCLMWNKFGRIFAIKSSDDPCIEVYFNNSAVHEDFVVENSANYMLGDVNNSLVALSSKSNADDRSELYVRNLASWDRDSRSWSTVMPEGEEICLLAVGSDFVAVYTEMRNVRIYSAHGLKRAVFSTAPSIRSMTAGLKSLALVRTASFLEDDDTDEYVHSVTLYDISVYNYNVVSKVCTMSLPLSPGSDLSWLSFSSKGRLVSMDTLFTVRLYSPNQTWVPVFVGAERIKEPQDSIWPICVTETPQPQFRFIYLRDRSQPSFKKTEVVSSEQLCIPVENMASFSAFWDHTDDAQSKLEAEVLLNELLANYSPDANNDAQFNKLLQEHSTLMVKTFAVCCQKQKQCRALELASIARHLQTVQVMCNFAARQQKETLSKKVADIGRSRSVLNATENDPPTSTNRPPTSRKVELKRRPSTLPERGGATQDETQTTDSMSVSESLGTPSSASAIQQQHNPFKRQTEFDPNTPSTKKPRGDLFDSMAD